MTFANFASYIRKQSGTNSTTFLDADILLYANIFKDEIARQIVRYKEDIFGIPETTDLQVDGGGVPIREYPLASDVFDQLQHVEAKLDGTNWVSLSELDLTEYRGTTDETAIVAKFGNTKDNARYDRFRGSLWLYTGTFAAVVGGLKIWTYQWPAEFTDLTSTADMAAPPTNTTAGFPRQFHELLARRVIIAKKVSMDKPMQLTDSERSYEVDLMRALGDLVPAKSVSADLPDENKWDNGFNL